MKIKVRILGIVLLSAAAHALAVQPTPADIATRATALHALLDAQWQHQLEVNPEFASTLGDVRYNDRWSDLSLAQAQRERDATADFIRRFQAIDPTGFSADDALNQQLIVRQLQTDLHGMELKLYEMPLEQFRGEHLLVPGYVSQFPFDNLKDYEDYLARLQKLPALFDQITDVAKQGMHDGLMPPKYLLGKVAKQIDDIAAPAADDSVFAKPLKQFAQSIAQADQQRLRAAILTAIDRDVRPAYRKLGEFVAKEYAPHGRDQPGMWSLPNGAAIYRFDVEQMTSTAMTPEQIHALGLDEVARIEKAMTVIAKAQGFADLADFRRSLKTNAKVHAVSREDILDRYRGYVARMQAALPHWFGLLPKTELVVAPIEAFREKEASAATYNQGTADGSQPGQLLVNTGNFAERSVLTIESIAYHEGVPGHHLQFSIAQTLQGLPPFRQQAGSGIDYIAYIEGWALYAEKLGKEMGFYTDPLSDYGRLSSELLRAVRLVLDTGVHYKHWTRDQMVDFFHAHSSEDEPAVQAETDRYIAWPGQALAYKVGELKILQLRARAKTQLGDRFDIRAFHDEILNGGPLPLSLLEARINAWIAASKVGAVAARTNAVQ